MSKNISRKESNFSLHLVEGVLALAMAFLTTGQRLKLE
jgi:hypothetical protein